MPAAGPALLRLITLRPAPSVLPPSQSPSTPLLTHRACSPGAIARCRGAACRRCTATTARVVLQPQRLHPALVLQRIALVRAIRARSRRRAVARRRRTNGSRDVGRGRPRRRWQRRHRRWRRWPRRQRRRGQHRVGRRCASGCRRFLVRLGQCLELLPFLATGCLLLGDGRLLLRVFVAAFVKELRVDLCCRLDAAYVW
jgi:hypothetical protein